MDNLRYFSDSISDEMLAAYIDGNAIPIEQGMIESFYDDEELQEILDLVSDIKANPELVEAVEVIRFEIPDSINKETSELGLNDFKEPIDNNTKIF